MGKALRLGAHPRSRGENGFRHQQSDGSLGSSPLTRGKLLTFHLSPSQAGLIPAHAGKTSQYSRSKAARRAHPRSRGENVNSGCCDLGHSGSSPLTRGKHFLTCAFIAQIGQILESLELCASSESYSLSDAYATGAPRDRVRSIGLAPPSSRVASSA